MKSTDISQTRELHHKAALQRNDSAWFNQIFLLNGRVQRNQGLVRICNEYTLFVHENIWFVTNGPTY